MSTLLDAVVPLDAEALGVEAIGVEFSDKTKDTFVVSWMVFSASWESSIVFWASVDDGFVFLGRNTTNSTIVSVMTKHAPTPMKISVFVCILYFIEYKIINGDTVVTKC